MNFRPFIIKCQYLLWMMKPYQGNINSRDNPVVDSWGGAYLKTTLNKFVMLKKRPSTVDGRRKPSTSIESASGLLLLLIFIVFEFIK